jgi:hypothetical protein
MELESIYSLRKEIKKRLDIITAALPAYEGKSYEDQIRFLNGAYGQFLRALQNVQAVKFFCYGIDTNDHLNVKIRIGLRGDCCKIKTENKSFIYDLRLL